jgi:hypothetical protein
MRNGSMMSAMSIAMHGRMMTTSTIAVMSFLSSKWPPPFGRAATRYRRQLIPIDIPLFCRIRHSLDALYQSIKTGPDFAALATALPQQ